MWIDRSQGSFNFPFDVLDITLFPEAFFFAFWPVFLVKRLLIAHSAAKNTQNAIANTLARFFI